jgi:PAS domain S-box-containing protein
MPLEELLKNPIKSEKEFARINELILESNEILNNYIDVSKTDLEGNITYVSKMFCQTMGYTEEELIGQSHNIVKSPISTENTYKNLWQSLLEENAFKGTIQNQSKNGELIWFDILIKPEFDENGIKTGYVAYRKNITEQKKLKELVDKQIEELREKDNQLHEQEKINAMGNMINNIAHQWRQPLSIISSVASGLSLKLELGMFDSNEAIKDLDELNNSVQYLSNTINDFSTFFQKDSKKEEINIIEIFDEVTATMQINIKNLNIQLINNFSNDIVMIKCFKGDLIQVLLNLFNNAQTALEKLDINERFLFTTIKEYNDYIEIIVSDNGGGIKEDIINNIFEPYFTTKHKAQGTGLGLFMSKEIITKLIKGNITVKNEKVLHNDKSYNGATFTVTIPKE